MNQRSENIFDIITSAPFSGQEAIRFLLGDLIGTGAYRSVYSFDFISDMVIKVCTTQEPANILEFSVWKAVKDTPAAKWFAPCHALSPEGTFMVQSKCRPIVDTDKLPKKLPQFFTDLKKQNFGFIGDQFVCHDYQFISRAIDYSMYGTQIVKWD